MNAKEFAAQLNELDAAVGRAFLARHAYEDAGDAAARVVAARAHVSAIRDAARISHALDIELRVAGARS